MFMYVRVRLARADESLNLAGAPSAETNCMSCGTRCNVLISCLCAGASADKYVVLIDFVIHLMAEHLFDQ